MKKILFSLVALVCSMSINAQQIKLMKGNTVVATYSAAQVDNVVFEETAITGIAKATINGQEVDVNWVQLWEKGPKFAEYNVGVTDGQASSYGGYYRWGSSIDRDPNVEYWKCSDALTGEDDTATKLWGSAWRMPTRAEFQALLDNCVVEKATVNGVECQKFTGKADPYKTNSMFLPCAGNCNFGNVSLQGIRSYYWSSTPGSVGAYNLYFNLYSQSVDDDDWRIGGSVRAVLAE